jgi:tetratricopeptide (TPR) repeat protein
VLATTALLAAAACTGWPRVDPRFAEHARAADEHDARGRHRAAAEAWLAAARETPRAHDRDEAVYRAARSYERAGDAGRAEALLLGLTRGRGARAARAAFDRARLVGERDPARGEALRLEALRAHPGSGVAPHALRTYLSGVEARDGEDGALARCRALLQELAATELDETLGYECAARSERRNELEAARAGYLRTAERHPYPRGALWDDALTGAARCEERLGRPQAAVATLERLLAEREHSLGLGSYERSRYAEARFHIAELYRDALGDPSRARAEFHRVASEHDTSLLGDDALFEAARLEERAGDQARACRTLRSLAERYPESRFVGCGRLICTSAPAGRRECADVTERKLERSETPD